MLFATDELSCDSFLGEKLKIWQPLSGYRAGADPVFLAAAVGAKPGQSVLELGCGAGVASLCLARRVPGVLVHGVELQEKYATLSRLNGAENDIGFHVTTADICALPADLRDQSFDHVFANPPYFIGGQRTAADDAGKEIALAGETPLGAWVDIGTRRLKPGGYLTIIQKAERLDDVLSALDARLGSVCVKPLAARSGRGADVVIVSARKGGRAKFSLLAPLILHQGDKHVRDGDSYSQAARQVLRDGAALDVR
ncbi:MAG: methyltransferase [Paracoccaceae bacterium]